MSRTKKGKKAPGSEYWSKRPGNKKGATPGKATKKATHKKERRVEFVTTVEDKDEFVAWVRRDAFRHGWTSAVEALEAGATLEALKGVTYYDPRALTEYALASDPEERDE